jgi:hypothetical protein
MRRLMALRAAGDILRVRVVRPLTPSIEAIVAGRCSSRMVSAASLRKFRRSGNALTNSDSSDCSSFQRTIAPRLASSRMEEECFGIVNQTVNQDRTPNQRPAAVVVGGLSPTRRPVENSLDLKMFSRCSRRSHRSTPPGRDACAVACHPVTARH